MPSEILKFTEQQVADIRARIKAMNFGAIEKATKAKARDKNGTFDVIISTQDKDRSGEVVMQNGWELTNYKNNPVVLWGHDYYSLPIGVCTETYLTEKNGVPALGARGVFFSDDINPLAQQVRRMYDYGIKSGLHVGCTTSVGFIPKRYDENSYSVIVQAELLEFSFVPVPANQGVGPAVGRAFTQDEAKELGLDMVGLAVKGVTFTQTKDVEQDAGDDEEDVAEDEAAEDEPADAVDAEAADEKTEDLKDPREPQKALVKSINTEHDRHADEIDRVIEDFQKNMPVATEEKPDVSEAIRDSVKNLRSAISDEHTTHKADTIKCFKGFEPTDEKKAFDINKHLKAVRTENAEYEARTSKVLDEFEERCLKAAKDGESAEEHFDWLADELEKSVRSHRKSLTHIAKSMAREALGESEITDEKTLEIVKSAIAPFIKVHLMPIAIRIASNITAERRNMLGEAYSNLKAATAIVEGLHGALGDSDGDENRSGDDNSSSSMIPEKKRSRPARAATTDAELEAHMFAREVLRGITTSATAGLERINHDLRARRT